MSECPKPGREAEFARCSGGESRLTPVSLGQMDILSYTRGNFWDIGKHNRAKNGTMAGDNTRKRAFETGTNTVTVLKTLMNPLFLRFSLSVRLRNHYQQKQGTGADRRGVLLKQTAERPCYKKDLPMSRRSHGSRGTGD